MYSPVKVEQLSKQQVSRLLNGHSVRIKHHPQGKHTVHLHKEQMKKLGKAHAKGGAINLTFDPYQIDHHQHLRSEVSGGSIKSMLKTAGTHIKKLAHQASPHVKHYVKHTLAPGAKKFAQEHILPEAKKFLHDEALKRRGSAEKLVEKALKPMFGEPLAHDLAMKGADAGYREFERGLGHASKHLGVYEPMQTLQEPEINAFEELPFADGMGLRRRKLGHHSVVGGAINWGKLGSQIKKAVTSKTGKKIQGVLLDEALKLGQATGKLSKAQANALKTAGHAGISAEGIKHLSIKLRKPRGRKRGGALYPAGY